MITDGKKWHYLAAKSLFALLRGITVNNNGDFYCLNCFRSYTTKNKLEKHKKVCKNHEEDNKILKYSLGEKSMTAPFVIYTDLECLLEKMSTCHNNPKKSSTAKVNKHTPSGYSLFTCCLFDITEIKLDCYRGKNCMKNFYLDLKEHVTKIMNYENEEMIPLTEEENTSYENKKCCYICKKGFNRDNTKVRDHCHYTGNYRGAAYSICNLRYKIPAAFHNGSTYDYHFIIKELAEEFEGQFECLGENNTEKYITLSVPIKKQITKIDKDGNDNIVNISYKIKFIDNFRFMSSSL